MDQVAPDEFGPHDPGMDARVSKLEEEMGDVRAILRRLEPMIVRMDAQLPYLATKEDVAALRGDFSTQFATLRGEVTTEIANVRGEVAGEIAKGRGEVTTEIAKVRGEVTGEIAKVRGEIVTLEGKVSTEFAKVRSEIGAFEGRVSTEFAKVRGEIGTLRGDVMAELATKPSRGAMWAMGIALFGLVAASMAAGAAYLPFIAERLNALK